MCIVICGRDVANAIQKSETKTSSSIAGIQWLITIEDFVGLSVLWSVNAKLGLLPFGSFPEFRYLLICSQNKAWQCRFGLLATQTKKPRLVS